MTAFLVGYAHHPRGVIVDLVTRAPWVGRDEDDDVLPDELDADTTIIVSEERFAELLEPRFEMAIANWVMTRESEVDHG